MNKIIVVFDLNKNTCEFNIGKEIKGLFLKYNIYDLEQFNEGYLYLVETNKNAFFILNSLIMKKNRKLETVIINTVYPSNARLFEQYSFSDMKDILMFNLMNTLSFIKSLIIFNINFNIIFLLHEVNKNQFFFENQMYNNVFMSLMATIHNEYNKTKNIRIVCVATNNVYLSYKKNVYPYFDTYNSINITFPFLRSINIVTNKLIFF